MARGGALPQVRAETDRRRERRQARIDVTPHGRLRVLLVDECAESSRRKPVPFRANGKGPCGVAICPIRHIVPLSKPLRWLGGTIIKSPPVGERARRDLGVALRVLQRGGQLTLPISRPMPSLGPRCHELRIGDESKQWRLIYRTDLDHILVVDLFRKSTRTTPKRALERCRRRLRAYDSESR